MQRRCNNSVEIHFRPVLLSLRRGEEAEAIEEPVTANLELGSCLRIDWVLHQRKKNRFFKQWIQM